MLARRASLLAYAVLLIGSTSRPVHSAEPGPVPPTGLKVEELSNEAGTAKIVLVAGSNPFKPGEHEYLAGCSVLMDLLRQTPGVAPVLAVDWPEKRATFEKARAVVFFLDGGDKHPLLKGDRFDQVRELADAGAGLVQLHQIADYPADRGDRARALMGGAWEKGLSKRAHWVAEFEDFPDHPIFRGVKPFSVDDGWLTGIRFVEGMKGVTPLLRTVPPQASGTDPAGTDAIVSWAHERPEGGRSLTFTGGHLHRSFAEEGYRRFLVNGILWTAQVEIPAKGASVDIDPAILSRPAPDRPASGQD